MKLNEKIEEGDLKIDSMNEKQLLESWNLTDNDKILKDDCKILKKELDSKNDEILEMENEIRELKLNIDEYKQQITLKDDQIDKVKLELNSEYTMKISDLSLKLTKVLKQCEFEENENIRLKTDLEIRFHQEQILKENLEKLNVKNDGLNVQMNEKISEIEFLNRENNSLLERVNLDDKRINLANNELENYKNKILNLNSQLEFKLQDVARLEHNLKSKENELCNLNLKLNIKELDIKHKLDECDSHRLELNSLEAKYIILSTDLDSKVDELTKEIDRLKDDKEKMYLDLQELRAKHSLYHHEFNNSNDKTSVVQNQNANAQANNLRNIELLATRTKYETKINVYELEINNLKAKIGKMLRVSYFLVYLRKRKPLNFT